MPQLIQKTLAKRLLQSPEFEHLRNDFSLLSGLPLSLYSAFGEPLCCPHCQANPLCRHLQDSPSGRSFCHRSHQKLLQEARQTPARLSCDAGLRLLALPIHAGHHLIGFLLTGGHRTMPPSPAHLHRSIHLLQIAQISLAPDTLAALHEKTPLLSEAHEASFVRFLSLAATQAGQRLLQLAHKTEDAHTLPLPAPIRRALLFMKTHFHQPLSLEETATHAGLSTGHLSRLFHHALGLRFSDYLNALRLEHARHLLTHTRLPIARIALDSGFQSLSQFNRRFKSTEGHSPRQHRYLHAQRSEKTV